MHFLKLYWQQFGRSAGAISYPCIFFLLTTSFCSIILHENNKETLFSIVLIIFFLSFLLLSPRLFQPHWQDGTLQYLYNSNIPFEIISFSAFLACCLFIGLPLLLLMPLAFLLTHIPYSAFTAILVALPSFAALTTISAALALGSKQEGILPVILMFPIALPVFLFAVGTTTGNSNAFYFLTSIALFLCAITPWITALALKNSIKN